MPLGTQIEHRLGLVRITAMVAISVLIATLPSFHAHRPIALIVVAQMVIEAILNRLTSPAWLDLARSGLTRVVAIIIIATYPEFWPLVFVAFTVDSVWLNIGGVRPASAALQLGSLLALAAVLPSPTDPAIILTAMASLAFTVVYYVYARQLRRGLNAQQDDLAHALSSAGAIVHSSDLLTGRATAVTGPVTAITGWTEEEWLASDHREFIHPDDLEGFWIDAASFTPQQVFDRKARFRHKDGHWLWIRDVSRVIDDPAGRPMLNGFSIDISEIENAYDVIRKQAETDELTGLANRSAMLADIDRRLAGGDSFSLFLLDLNRFKDINDTLGHNFGDQVLKLTAERLRYVCQPPDLVARLGGDEFAIVAGEEGRLDAVTHLADRLATATSRPLLIGGVSVTAGAAVGVARTTRPGADAHTLLRHADIAMYEAKRTGAGYRLFGREIEKSKLDDLTLTASIGRALAENEFVLHFQPKVEIGTRAVYGVEGLARWNHPTLGLLDAERFIELVTFSDDHIAFTDQVITEGARFAAACRDRGSPIQVAVNISARSLHDRSLPERTAQTLAMLDLDPALLLFEITEQDIMEESTDATSVIDRLSTIGVGLSIDDFGTGFSSLARLIDLPASEVKIDRRFVHAAPRSESDRVVIRTIVDLAKHLDLDVVAEGVETAEQAELLDELDCSRAQGHLYSPPVPDEQLLDLLVGPTVAIGTSGIRYQPPRSP